MSNTQKKESGSIGGAAARGHKKSRPMKGMEMGKTSAGRADGSTATKRKTDATPRIVRYEQNLSRDVSEACLRFFRSRGIPTYNFQGDRI